ncbi:MAG: DUF819 family protein [Gemmatimonadales bacterium]|jgi:uncharacterized membrane protein
MIADPLAVLLVLAAVVYGSLKLEERFTWARALGATLLAILLAAALSNVGLLPHTSPTYDLLSGVGVNLGIALVLLGVNIHSVVRAGPRMLAAFALGAVGTVVGAIVAAFTVARHIGPETWKLAGQYAGTYTGGGVNMVAVGRTVDTSPDLFAAAIAADNVTTAIWMIVCLGVPLLAGLRLLGRSARREAEPTVGEGAPRAPDAPAGVATAFTATREAVTLKETAVTVLLAVGVVWAAGQLGRIVPQVPEVLWLTTLVLVIAQLPAVRRLGAPPVLGNYLLQLFLAGLGAQSVVVEILRVGPAVFYFTLLVVAVHGLLLFGVGRALGFDLPTLAVASQANIGGPPSAMALATARGYVDRLLPGVAVGLLGYAGGNYIGLGVAHLMRAWLGA